MSNDPADLPEILTRPLEADEELRVTVKADLEGRMGHFQARKGEITAEQAMKGLPGQMAKMHGRWRRIAVAFGVLMLCWLWAVAKEVPEAAVAAADGPVMLTWRPVILQRLANMRMAAIRGAGRDFQEPWQRYQDLESGKASAWREDQDNPATYLGWAADRVRERRDLPADYDEVWRRIDPDNAVWLLLKATRLVVDAYGGGGRSHVKVVDPAAFDQALACVEEASHLPRFDAYGKERTGLVRDSFLPPQCCGEAVVVASNVSRFAWDIRGGLSASSMERMIAELTARGDDEGVRRLVAADQRCQVRYAMTDLRRYEYRKTDDHQTAVLGSLRKTGGAAVDAGALERIGKLRNLLRVAYAKSPGAGTREIRTLDDAAEKGTMDAGWEVAQAREGLLAMAGLVLVAVTLLGLRMLPQKSVGAATARSLEPLLPGLRPLGFLLLILPGLWMLQLFFLRESTDTLTVRPQMLRECAYDFVVVLAALVIAGRGGMDRRVGFLGYRARWWSRLPGYTLLAVLLLIPVLLACPDGNHDKVLQDLWPLGGVAAALTLLWMGMRAGMGLMTPDGNVRHRLLARRLIPVCLLWVALLMPLVAWMHGLERQFSVNDSAYLWTDRGCLKPDRKMDRDLRELLEGWK